MLATAVNIMTGLLPL